jgi:manganese/zinc/iron transport system permease protein
LIAHADFAPSQVDRQADAIEHVLEPELIRELVSLLDQQDIVVPASPHPVEELKS